LKASGLRLLFASYPEACQSFDYHQMVAAKPWEGRVLRLPF
jgi:hypothetical protein